MRMKVFFIVIFFIVFVTNAFCQQQKGFEINGRIEGLRQGEKILLGHFINPGKPAVRDDSCFATSAGDIHLKSMAPDKGPYFYLIAFDNEVKHRLYNEQLQKYIGGGAINLLVKNGDKISIRGDDINKMQQNYFEDEIFISGSSTNSAYLSLKPVFFTIDRGLSIINHRIEKIRDSIGFDKSMVAGLVEARSALENALDATIFIGYPFSNYQYASIPLMIDYISNYHLSIIAKLYESLDSTARGSYFGRQLKEKVALAIGQILPGFTLPTSEGKMISLKSVAETSKLTIVHLWASNSIEREMYQKELKVFYNKYHTKGLNIIGVSADSITKEWKLRLMAEEFPWANVSDLKGNLAGGFVQDIYHEGGHSVPNTTNILIDSQGRIIAWDPVGAELQWYLSKYLGD